MKERHMKCSVEGCENKTPLRRTTCSDECYSKKMQKIGALGGKKTASTYGNPVNVGVNDAQCDK